MIKLKEKSLQDHHTLSILRSSSEIVAVCAWAAISVISSSPACFSSPLPLQASVLWELRGADISRKIYASFYFSTSKAIIHGTLLFYEYTALCSVIYYQSKCSNKSLTCYITTWFWGRFLRQHFTYDFATKLNKGQPLCIWCRRLHLRLNVSAYRGDWTQSSELKCWMKSLRTCFRGSGIGTRNVWVQRLNQTSKFLRNDRTTNPLRTNNLHTFHSISNTDRLQGYSSSRSIPS